MSTLTVLVLLFGYHTSTSSRRPPRRARSAPIGGRTGGATGSASAPSARPSSDAVRARRPASSGGAPSSGDRAGRHAPTTVTGDGRRHPLGPGAGADHRRRRQDHRRVRRRSTRTATAATRRSTPSALPILIQETLNAQSANDRHGQRRDRHQRRLPAVAAERAGPGGAVTAPRSRGRPRAVRRARDGHADQPRAARPAHRRRGGAGRLGRGDGRAARGGPGVQHLPRRLGRLPARPGRDRLRATARRRSPRCSRSAAAAQASRAARSASGCPGPDGGPSLDPSGVVKGWAVRARRRRPARAAGHRLLPVRRRRHDLPDRRPGRATPWRIGIEDPLDPSRMLAVVPVRTGAVATSGHRPPRAAPGRCAHRPAADRGGLGHRHRGLADLGRHRRHRRLRARAPTRPAGWTPGPAAPAWSCGPTARPPPCRRQLRPIRLRRSAADEDVGHRLCVQVVGGQGAEPEHPSMVRSRL